MFVCLFWFSLSEIMAVKINNIRDFKKPLKVKFEGEVGIDEGGLVKEWFQLLVAQIFSPQYGMFVRNESMFSSFLYVFIIIYFIFYFIFL
jgi:hypothetical protein